MQMTTEAPVDLQYVTVTAGVTPEILPVKQTGI